MLPGFMRALTIDVLVEFVVLGCGTLGAFSDISEFEAVEVDVDGISAKLSWDSTVMLPLFPADIEGQSLKLMVKYLFPENQP